MSSPSKSAAPIAQSPAPTSPKKKAGQPPAPGGGEKKGASAKEAKAARRAAKLASRPPAPDEPPTPTAATSSAAASSPAAAAAAAQSGPSRHRRAVAAEQAAAARPTAPPNPAQQYFSHLPVPRDAGTPAAFASGKIHPLVVRLGVLIASGTLRGASARTMAVLEAFREVVRDYNCPENAVFWKDLNSHISPMIAYLETCRPKGVGVGNAIRWFKGEINRLGEAEGAAPHLGPGGGAAAEAAQKAALIEAIGVYIRDRIVVAGQVIADNAREKIKPDDTVVVYARSSVVERALLEAHAHMKARDSGASFNVVVVDSRPLYEGEYCVGDETRWAGDECVALRLERAAG